LFVPAGQQRSSGVREYAFGIDTGGTFTDGVVCDLTSGSVICTTKVITTRSNLALSISECLDNLTGRLRELNLQDDVVAGMKMVSLSTTLATNAIVEGQGAEVGLILIGFDPDRELPTPHRTSISGGCTIHGDIRREADLGAARKFIQSMKGTVEAFAVSGYMSVRNPSQERAVENLVHELSGCPVVCAHELSADLGMFERTVTCVLNARLIPLVTHLVRAVRAGLDERDISAPIMVVKGDGSLISEQTAMDRPVETVLSGPAASMVGGTVLSNRRDCIVVDMGGTTTDIAIVTNGRPAIREQGAEVGGWLTRVKAAEITTIGLGGDSFIKVTGDRRMLIGPQKVFPLCWAASVHPHLCDELELILKSGYNPRNSQPTCVFFHIHDPKGLSLTDTEKRIMDLIRDEPHSLHWVARKLGMNPDIVGWERLVNIGSIHRANLTPTDVLHVTGDFLQWDCGAARTGLSIIAGLHGSSIDRFTETFFRQFSLSLFGLIVDKLTSMKIHGQRAAPGTNTRSAGATGTGTTSTNTRSTGGTRAGRPETRTSGAGHLLTSTPEGRFVLERMFDTTGEHFRFLVEVSLPVVAVGAPASVYFPDVVQRLKTELVLPEWAEVANAVGTVNGKVEERVKILIKPGETGGFFVYSPEERRIFRNLDQALEHGERTGRRIAEERARQSGARTMNVRVERHDRYGLLSQNVADPDGDEAPQVFIESVLDFIANGNPW
jgi:N-methylhydantoinase A/oxoprolinase/acetone carboxylase beta subunit